MLLTPLHDARELCLLFPFGRDCCSCQWFGMMRLRLDFRPPSYYPVVACSQELHSTPRPRIRPSIHQLRQLAAQRALPTWPAPVSHSRKAISATSSKATHSMGPRTRIARLVHSLARAAAPRSTTRRAQLMLTAINVTTRIARAARLATVLAPTPLPVQARLGSACRRQEQHVVAKRVGSRDATTRGWPPGTDRCPSC